MKRILLFAGGFLGVAFLLFFLVFGLNINSFRSLLENREGIAEGSEWVGKTQSLKGLTEYIEEFPDLVSIASITPGQPDSSLFLRENMRHTMGTMSNFFLMTAWADAFEQGVFDPAQRIHWSEIDRLQLPGLGENTLQAAREAATEQGLLDEQDSIALEDAPGLLNQHNSPALSDYLLLKLGEERLEETLGKLQLVRTDFPVPLSGLMLTLSPAIQQLPANRLLADWERQPHSALRQAAWEAAKQLNEGPERERWLKKVADERLGLTFIEERDMLVLWPKTTASEMAGLLERMLAGELISEQVSSRVTEWMRYPMNRRPLTRNFQEYGAMFDNRMGMLNGIDFGTSAYNGKPAIQAVFFDQLQVAVWMHMSSNHMHQDFQQRLIWDPEIFTIMKQVIRATETRQTANTHTES